MILRIAAAIARILCIICIPFIILTGVLGIAFNFVPLYTYGFEKYDVSDSTGLADSELTKIAQGLISYFNSDENNLELIVEKDGVSFVLFTREEALHMKDVKGLVRLDYGVLMGTLVYVIGYALAVVFLHSSRRKLARSILFGSLLTLILMLALWLGSLWDFDTIFYQFHLLAFTNDFWSAEGYMLLLFPGGFWYDTTIFCVLGMVIIAALSGGASAAYLFFTGKGLLFNRLMS
jgi:integral membrane protein (TIGR01906 family)